MSSISKCVQVVSFHTSCSGFLDSFDDDILEGHSCKISNFQNDTKAVRMNTKPGYNSQRLKYRAENKNNFLKENQAVNKRH